MFSKFTIAIFCFISNIILYLLMMHFDKQAGMHHYFWVTQKVLLISVIMQILYAIGFIKTAKQ